MLRTRPGARWLLAASLAASVLTIPVLASPDAAAVPTSAMYWTRYSSTLPIGPGGLNGTAVATATDPGGGVVTFGGTASYLSPSSSGSTYVWDGMTWSLRLPTVSPPPRENAAMSYDGVGHAVMFGGIYRQLLSSGWVSTQRTDTWVWDGTAWTEQHPTSTPQGNGRMAAEGPGRTLLFGGATGNETWRWEGSQWTELQPQHRPSPRVRFGIAGEGNGAVLLHGGVDESLHRSFSDTWRWDGQDWTELHPAHPPSATAGVNLASLPGGRDLLVGCCPATGYDPQTWLWDGTDWTLAVLPVEPAYDGGQMAADATGRVVLADGLPVGGFNYTWVWQPVPPPSEIDVQRGSLDAVTAVATPYPDPLVAVPVDRQGVPLAGIVVTFTLPATGPSARFDNGSQTATVTSDATGRATSPPPVGELGRRFVRRDGNRPGWRG